MSRLIKVYEKLGKKVDRDVVYQYIQHWKIAKDFANYLELYTKYKKDYGLERILAGQNDESTLEKIKFAAFDERLSVVSLLLGRLGEMMKDSYACDRYVTEIYGYMKQYKEMLGDIEWEGMDEKLYANGGVMKTIYRQAAADLEETKRKEELSRQERGMKERVVHTLETYWKHLKEHRLSGEAGFEEIKKLFAKETENREVLIENAARALDAAFDFMEDAFGEGQEMVVFITELNTNFYSVQFLKDNDCDKYYKYNKGLLLDERQKEILDQMDEIESEVERKLM